MSTHLSSSVSSNTQAKAKELLPSLRDSCSYLCIVRCCTEPSWYSTCPISVLLPASTWPEHRHQAVHSPTLSQNSYQCIVLLASTWPERRHHAVHLHTLLSQKSYQCIVLLVFMWPEHRHQAVHSNTLSQNSYQCTSLTGVHVTWPQISSSPFKHSVTKLLSVYSLTGIHVTWPQASSSPLTNTVMKFLSVYI